MLVCFSFTVYRWNSEMLHRFRGPWRISGTNITATRTTAKNVLVKNTICRSYECAEGAGLANMCRFIFRRRRRCVYLPAAAPGRALCGSNDPAAGRAAKTEPPNGCRCRRHAALQADGAADGRRQRTETVTEQSTDSAVDRDEP